MLVDYLHYIYMIIHVSTVLYDMRNTITIVTFATKLKKKFVVSIKGGEVHRKFD